LLSETAIWTDLDGPSALLRLTGSSKLLPESVLLAKRISGAETSVRSCQTT
jgi:hypothetical protein